MLTVLITTSGTGSRLGIRTHHTNKSLLKIGDVYAICHIINLYPSDTEFIVTIGYFGSHVKEFLSLAYPEYNIHYVDVDIYEGEGSSLGYSMLKAKEFLQKPFYFHCCDTILKNRLEFSDKNCLYVCKGNDRSMYASIQTNGSSVLSLNSKGAENHGYLYIGLCFIQNFSLFWKNLQNIYNQNTSNTSLSDVNAIGKMINDGESFSFCEVTEWFDTGNEESLRKTHEAFTPSYSVIDKYDESLCFFKTHVIKFFSDSGTCTKRVVRGNTLYPLTPKIIGSTHHFFSMEKIEGEVLSKSNVYGDIKKLLEWSWENLWTKQKTDDQFKVQSMNFYKKKTVERLSKIPFLSNEKTFVNGIHVGSWKELLERVDFTLLSTDTFTYFHGDFILDNIIKFSDESFKLLDWRQDFDGNLLYGDMYYDLAKLRHNIYFNHQNILNDLYSITYDHTNAYVDLKCNYIHIHQEKEIEKFCQGNNLNYTKVQILTAIIWLNMAPLYEGKLREFLFYFGKYNLSTTLNTPITVL